MNSRDLDVYLRPIVRWWWLIVLAASIGFAGPVTALVLGAVLGGGGFLATAAWVTLRRRRRG